MSKQFSQIRIIVTEATYVFPNQRKKNSTLNVLLFDEHDAIWSFQLETIKSLAKREKKTEQQMNESLMEPICGVWRPMNRCQYVHAVAYSLQQIIKS